MSRFPIEYEIELAKSGSDPAALTSGHRPRVLTGPPPEFGGTDTWWSPEHLLVAAAASCMTATFYSMAERVGMHVGTFRCRGKGILDRSDKTIAFTSIVLAVDVTVAQGDVTRARALLDDAKARCFVANSLRATVELIAEVSGA